MKSLCAVAFLAAPVSVFADKAQSTSMFGSVLPMMAIMFLIIYFLMIRPEQRKQKQRQKMINEMKKGDRVLTVGGMYGAVQSVKGDVVMVKITNDVVVEMTKSAVSSVINKDDAAEQSSEKK